MKTIMDGKTRSEIVSRIASGMGRRPASARADSTAPPGPAVKAKPAVRLNERKMAVTHMLPNPRPLRGKTKTESALKTGAGTPQSPTIKPPPPVLSSNDTPLRAPTPRRSSKHTSKHTSTKSSLHIHLHMPGMGSDGDSDD